MSRFLAAESALRRPGWSVAMFALVLVSAGGSGSVSNAQLKVYYDPATGNVAFDTTNTRSGALNFYMIRVSGSIDPNDPYRWIAPPWTIRHENVIRLSQSTLYVHSPYEISDVTFDGGWRGLYTIGDVLPVGLSEEFWTTSFVNPGDSGLDPRYYAPYVFEHNDVLGGGNSPDATFIYGRPEGEFDNKWDMVDPDQLTWATRATLIYRDWNGEVLIDTTGPDGGYISNLLLRSEGRFVPEGFMPYSNSPLNEANDSAIFHYSDALEPGIYSLGTVLESGLSPDEFANLFTEAKFLGRVGFRGGSFNFSTHGVDMALPFVPEPGSLGLLTMAFAVAGISVNRRR